ncbi:MAG: hypothetical protein HY328_00875 [Chloroflexi bacterium]|nr:hypothetical protein [Chloroflexota bacterium]
MRACDVGSDSCWSQRTANPGRSGQADAQFVRARTGFVIGGVPPVGHAEALTTLIDADLLAFDEIWAAAGTPNAVFRLLPAELVAITGGLVADVRREE